LEKKKDKSVATCMDLGVLIEEKRGNDAALLSRRRQGGVKGVQKHISVQESKSPSR